jgi:hypothetical protein
MRRCFSHVGFIPKPRATLRVSFSRGHFAYQVPGGQSGEFPTKHQMAWGKSARATPKWRKRTALTVRFSATVLGKINVSGCTQ